MNANLITPNGASVKFTFPLIDTWSIEYENENSNVKINNQSIDPGVGSKRFTESTVELGANHVPLSEND
jgi:ABC-type phosphate transport system substrate-binding protein